MQKKLLDAQELLRGSQESLQALEKNDRRQKSEFNETQLALQRLVKEEKTVVSLHFPPLSSVMKSN
jgi:hypothetical protein